MPFWRDRAVVWQVFVTVAVVVGAVWLLVVVFAGADGNLDTPAFVLLTGAFGVVLGGLLALAFAVMVIVQRGRVYCYELDEEGVTVSLEPPREGRPAMVQVLVVLSQWVTGASRRNVVSPQQPLRVLWKETDSFWVSARRPRISLKKGRRTLVVVRCTRENLDTVTRYFRDHVRHMSTSAGARSGGLGCWLQRR